MNFIQRFTQTGNMNLAILLLRLWFGTMMMYHGITKYTNGIDGFIGFIVNKLGMPEIMGWLAVGGEVIGGLLLVLGLFTRVGAILTGITMLVAVFVAHANDSWSDKEFPLTYAIISLVLLISGGGLFSADAKVFSNKSST